MLLNIGGIGGCWKSVGNERLKSKRPIEENVVWRHQEMHNWNLTKSCKQTESALSGRRWSDKVLAASKECWKEDGKQRWTNCPPSPSGHIFGTGVATTGKLPGKIRLWRS